MPLSGGGVWGWGGVSVDAAGNVYAAVGNVDTNHGSPAPGPSPPFVQDSDENDGFGEHFLELTSNLSMVEQSNYPGFTYGGISNDLDLSGTPVLAPPLVGTLGCDPAAAMQGKSGYLYVYDTTRISSGPTAGFKFSSSSSLDPNLGNPAYSPITGLYYGAVPSSVAGGVTQLPGMIAFPACNPTNITWTAQFGPDSATANAPRSAPTVTAGGVVFVATPCERDSSGGCTGTSGTYGGAVWALDASSGAMLNDSEPILTTPDQIRMAVVADADWIYLIDQQGYFYGLTIDPSVPEIPNTFARPRRTLTAPVFRRQAH
jgi:hypothetical protein